MNSTTPPPLSQQSRAWKGVGHPRAEWRGLKTRVEGRAVGAWRKRRSEKREEEEEEEGGGGGRRGGGGGGGEEEEEEEEGKFLALAANSLQAGCAGGRA